MAEKRGRLETKVGLFFLAALIILAVITFKVEDMGALFKSQVAMRARFPGASGMKPGDIVAVAGLKVGEVDRIELRDDGVEVFMRIDKNVRIREDATAEVAWGGLLGNRYINISLGDPSVEPVFLEPDSLIRTEPSVELTAVLKQINRAATKFENMLAEGNVGTTITSVLENIDVITTNIREERGSLGKAIGSDELHKEAVAMTTEVKKAASRIEAIVSGNEERITRIMTELETTVPQAREAFASITQLTEKINGGDGILAALINDEEMRVNLAQSLERLSNSLDHLESFVKTIDEGEGLIARLAHDKKFADNLADAVKSFKDIVERLDKGEGTMARILRDSDMYDDVKKLISDARGTLRSIRDQVPIGTFAGFLLGAF